MPNFDSAEALSLIAQTYESASSPAIWPETMERLRAAFGANVISVHGQPGTQTANLWLHSEMNPASILTYREHFHEVDLVVKALPRIPFGEVAHCDTLIPRPALTNTEFFNDWLFPQNFWTALLVNWAASSSSAASIIINRARKQPEFTNQESRFIAAIAPHIARSVDVYCRLHAADLRAAQFEAALIHHVDSVLIIRHDGSIEYANNAAERLLELGDGLRSQRGRLLAIHSDDNRLLRSTLAQRIASATIAIRRHSNFRPYSMTIFPLKGLNEVPIDRQLRHEKSCLVFVVDPDRNLNPHVAYLQQAFRLTPMETTIAMSIGRGEDLSEVADNNAISLATARWHLKHILSKTNTRKQSQLAVLMAALARPQSRFD